jgi:hypothetical protein
VSGASGIAAATQRVPLGKVQLSNLGPKKERFRTAWQSSILCLPALMQPQSKDPCQELHPLVSTLAASIRLGKNFQNLHRYAPLRTSRRFMENSTVKRFLLATSCISAEVFAKFTWK